MNSILQGIDYQQLVDIIVGTEKRLVFCSPNLFSEVTSAISEIHSKGVSVGVVIDPTEEMFRYGYGEVKAIDNLLAKGVDIYELPSFICHFQ